MKKKLVEDIACPGCHSDLACTIFEEEHQEILSGVLQCASCRQLFPVIAGIPCLLLAPSNEMYRDIHEAFYQKFHDRLPQGLPRMLSKKEAFASKKKKATQESFSFEWEILIRFFPCTKTNSSILFSRLSAVSSTAKSS